jgi:hypothetical protein
MFKDELFTGAPLRTKCLRDKSFTGAPRGCYPDGEQPDHRQAVQDGGAEERQQPRTRTGDQKHTL